MSEECASPAGTGCALLAAHLCIHDGRNPAAISPAGRPPITSPGAQPITGQVRTFMPLSIMGDLPVLHYRKEDWVKRRQASYGFGRDA